MRWVLLVHDDPGLLDQFATAVRAAGISARATTSPMTALDILETAVPAALVTRIDFGPHTLNGLALGRMARLRHPGLPVIFACYQDWADLPDSLGPVVRIPAQPRVLVDTLM